MLEKILMPYISRKPYFLHLYLCYTWNNLEGSKENLVLFLSTDHGLIN